MSNHPRSTRLHRCFRGSASRARFSPSITTRSGHANCLAVNHSYSNREVFAMRSILVGAALVFLCFGCASVADPQVGEDEASLLESGGATTNIDCNNITTCVEFCLSDYFECIANGGPPHTCQIEKRECGIDLCKRGVLA